MFFVGQSFVSDSYALRTTPVEISKITQITISGGAYDDLYVTRGVQQPYTTDISTTWDYDTILHAYFRNNLSGGNVEFTVENTDLLRIKRRIRNTFNWVYLYEITVTSADDFTFEFFDYTARSNTEYEYALVPVSGTAEGEYVINSLKTNFVGLFIMEKGRYFVSHLVINSRNQQQNKPRAVYSTLGRRYPYVISNGSINYKSGSITAIFTPFNEMDCELTFDDAWKLRLQLNEFLFNGYPKLLKYDNGEMWLISISGSTISEAETEHEHAIQTTFEWVEVGDCDSGRDLKDFNDSGATTLKDESGNVAIEASEAGQRLNKLEHELIMLRSEKADDIKFDDEKGTIMLTAEGVPIGSEVDLETPFGKELLVELLS